MFYIVIKHYIEEVLTGKSSDMFFLHLIWTDSIVVQWSNNNKSMWFISWQMNYFASRKRVLESIRCDRLRVILESFVPSLRHLLFLRVSKLGKSILISHLPIGLRENVWVWRYNTANNLCFSAHDMGGPLLFFLVLRKTRIRIVYSVDSKNRSCNVYVDLFLTTLAMLKLRRLDRSIYRWDFNEQQIVDCNFQWLR